MTSSPNPLVAAIVVVCTSQLVGCFKPANEHLDATSSSLVLEIPVHAGEGAAPAVQDVWMLTGGDDDYGKERRRILLEAYEQIRTFDITTLQLIEPLRALRMIHFSAWIARRWEDSAFKAAFPDFGTEHYWQEQIEALALQLEKVQYDTTDLYR